MRITKTFRYQVKDGEILYFKFAGSCRYIFNHELACTIEALDKNQFLTYNDYAKEPALLKRQPEIEWLKEAPAQILQQALMDLDKAMNVHYKSKDKKKKIGFPRFKKKGVKDSFRYHQLAQSIADISWYMLISMIEYKARWQGKSFVKSDKYEPTSKRCSSCGSKKPMPLHERPYN